MVTVGTRKVSAVKWEVDGCVSVPMLVTRISRLPFCNNGDGIEIVGRRLFGMDWHVSPYLV